MAKTKRPPQTRKKLGGPRIHDGGPRRDKVAAVDDFKTRLEASSAVLLTEYRGLSVKDIADLRVALSEAGADYKIYKNTLATIAVRDAGLEDLARSFEGPTAFTFATGDPVLAAKKLTEFAKRVPALVLKGGVYEKKILSPADINALGNLESREVLLAKLAGLFLTPIQQMANLMAAPLNQLGSVLAQLKDKTPGDAAPAEPAAAPEPTAEAPADAAPAEAPTAEAPAAEPTSSDAGQASDGSAPEAPAADAASEEPPAAEAAADEAAADTPAE